MENIQLSLDQFRKLGSAQINLIETLSSNFQFNPIVLTATVTNLDLARSKQNYGQKLYFKLTDGITVIQAISDINIVKEITDNSLVRIVCFCQPFIGFDKESLEIKANIIQISPINRTSSLPFIDHTSIRLKKLKSKPHRFPTHQTPSVSLIYSSAIDVATDSDFIETLGQHLQYVKLEKKQINLSDSKQLMFAIEQSQSDILIIVRGGGDENTLESFDNDLVLQALSNCKAYRIIGVGHAPNHNLINLIADFSAITPTAAASHLKEQLIENFKFNKKMIDLNKTIEYQKQEIATLKNTITEDFLNSEELNRYLSTLEKQQSEALRLSIEQNEKTFNTLKIILLAVIVMIICFFFFK